VFSLMRWIKVALMALGLGAVAFFVHRVGTAPIADALERLAWWQVVLACLPFALITAVDTLGWRFAFARDRAAFAHLYGARLAGEALNVVTALGSVGGEAVKAWLLRRDVAYEESVPAVVIAKTTITVAQALFLAIGTALAWTAGSVDARVVTAMLWLVAVEGLAVAGFVGVQVLGVVGRVGRLLASCGVIARGAMAQSLDTALRRFYRDERRRLALSTACHLTGWLLGAVEAWVMLWCLGVHATLADATAIEALGAGVRFATFLVPSNLGALEGAYAAAFEAMGFGAGTGLAFSFLRRARQVVWVMIGMIVLAAMGWASERSPALRPRSAPAPPRPDAA